MIDLSSAPFTLILLVLNVFVFGYVVFIDHDIVGRFSFRPVPIRERRQYYRFISAGFVHAELWHIAFNMITLYFFGPWLEAVYLGSGFFLILYFGSEVAAHALTFYYHKNDEHYAAIGASGAISGVVFAFCLYEPFAELRIFFAIPMPAIVFAVLYVVGSIYAMKRTHAGEGMGRIAHEAHLGGAIGGLLLTLLLDPSAFQIFVGQVRTVIGGLF